MIDAHTTVCGIIGDPVEHSLSPAMHNSAYRELGLNWAYLAFRVTDIAGAAAGMRALGIRGMSVTIPHKLEIIRHLDEVDDVALWIGSVNTIVNDGGRLRGMNTDGAGAMKALDDAGVELVGKRVTVLGSGGAARAVAMTLAAKAGLAEMLIMGIVPDELARLVGDVREKTGLAAREAALGEETLAKALPDTDVLIHCTPIGMHPREGESVVPPRLLRPGLDVMDIVYNPRETRFIADARAAGCRVVYGLEMLLNQGVLQFELWTGKKAPVEVMRQALIAWLER